MAIDDIQEIITVSERRISGILNRLNNINKYVDSTLKNNIDGLEGQKALTVDGSDLCDVALKNIKIKIADFCEYCNKQINSITSAVEIQGEREREYFKNLLREKQLSGGDYSYYDNNSSSYNGDHEGGGSSW